MKWLVFQATILHCQGYTGPGQPWRMSLISWYLMLIPQDLLYVSTMTNWLHLSISSYTKPSIWMPRHQSLGAWRTIQNTPVFEPISLLQALVKRHPGLGCLESVSLKGTKLSCKKCTPYNNDTFSMLPLLQHIYLYIISILLCYINTYTGNSHTIVLLIPPLL